MIVSMLTISIHFFYIHVSGFLSETSYFYIHVSGFLSETSGSYTSSFVLGGVAMVTASALMIYPIIYHRRRERLHLDTKNDLIIEKKISKPSEKRLKDTKVPLIKESKVPLEA